jgi:hypothetical protein
MPPTFGLNLKRYGASRPVTTGGFSIPHRTARAVPLKVGGIGLAPYRFDGIFDPNIFSKKIFESFALRGIQNAFIGRAYVASFFTTALPRFHICCLTTTCKC